ncbi:MAG: hypothetical protein C3F11_13760 [Methylocystaceae bacterium]|nr:MAG: hypothetical protein C3F11_13760 [Methylocystaceae bacterium]
MQAVAAERDRHAADKIELIVKVNAQSKELDGLYEQLAAVTAEHDSLRLESNAIIAERDSLRLQLDSASAERDSAAAATARVAEENERLRNQIASASAPDPAVVIVDFASEKTKALVAKARAAIPADSPALPWFDRTVSALTTAGCVTVEVTRETARWLAPRIKEAYAWAAPRTRELYAKAKTELDAKLAKKD